MLRDRTFVACLLAIFGVPLVAMALLPLSDTSEPRYAEIARLMAESGDWITPWFSPGVPFWGKPPLSFWAQALAFRWLGVTEFAVRLPSWLALLGSTVALYHCVAALFDRAVARRAVLILGSCALSFVASGAVLTDPFLALGTTLCMTGWLMASYRPTLFWRYSFFIGLSVGLLAKGPLVLVMVAGVLVPWLVLYPSARSSVRALPWVTGSLLAAVLTLPWYLAAEWKTPGFLDYFIVGEHFRRFLDPGWAGDLYGTAHQAARGRIWYYWLQATFPWGAVALVLLLKALTRPVVRLAAVRLLRGNSRLVYFLGWAFFTPVFFTFSGNILWTYVLPSLAGFSVVLAVLWPAPRTVSQTVDSSRAPVSAVSAPLGRLTFLVFVAPVVVSVLVAVGMLKPELLKTEKGLVNYAHQVASGNPPLLYLDELPFSARFYSRNTAIPVTQNQVNEKLRSGQPFLLAVPKDRADSLADAGDFKPVFQSRRHVLLMPAGAANRQVAGHRGATAPSSSIQ